MGLEWRLRWPRGGGQPWMKSSHPTCSPSVVSPFTSVDLGSYLSGSLYMLSSIRTSPYQYSTLSLGLMVSVRVRALRMDEPSCPNDGEARTTPHRNIPPRGTSTAMSAPRFAMLGLRRALKTVRCSNLYRSEPVLGRCAGTVARGRGPSRCARSMPSTLGCTLRIHVQSRGAAKRGVVR